MCSRFNKGQQGQPQGVYGHQTQVATVGARKNLQVPYGHAANYVKQEPVLMAKKVAIYRRPIHETGL